MKVTFIQPDGKEQDVDVNPGTTLMEAALFEGVPGILGMCGGICSCATCHCHVEADDFGRLPAAAAGEIEVLDGLEQRRPNSRLACQITMDDALEGIRLHVATGA
ncbi:MAG: 2Fe-2S iron-sulfur cluster binding domain-containing protein [Proteobacteria bacterium]|nr:2Fe-2S iron-sulfur cluster binding domain-containing protein [Pseudomonadota bacterium]HQR02726.1 2Fe-2S iron-sulfur cluster-binding protein [Rhodocyclaceae bacterium]